MSKEKFVSKGGCGILSDQWSTLRTSLIQSQLRITQKSSSRSAETIEYQRRCQDYTRQRSPESRISAKGEGHVDGFMESHGGDTHSYTVQVPQESVGGCSCKGSIDDCGWGNVRGIR